jgi:hypothetical protein
VAELPHVQVLAPQAVQLRHGQWAQPSRPGCLGTLPGGGEVAVFGPGGDLIGVARLDGAGSLLLPVKILPAEKGAS